VTTKKGLSLIQRDPHRALAIFELYLKYQNQQAVAEELRMSVAPVHNVIVALGITRPRQGWPRDGRLGLHDLNPPEKLAGIRCRLQSYIVQSGKVSADGYHQTLEHYLGRWSCQQVGQILGIGPEEVQRRLDHLGVEWRPGAASAGAEYLDWLLDKLRHDPDVVIHLVNQRPVRPKRLPPHITAAQALRAFELYCQHQSLVMVSGLTGIPSSTLHGWLRSQGVILPRPGGSRRRRLKDWNPPGRLEAIAERLKQAAKLPSPE
jgi:hypothetical protein